MPQYVQFKGLLPGIDRKRVQEPFVVDGNNFLVDADGPYSGFGRTVYAPFALEEPRGITGIKLADNRPTFLFANGGVFQTAIDMDGLVPLYEYTKNLSPWPWTHALVGGKHYFARRGVGLLQYDDTLQSWSIISGGDVPADIVGCTEAGGRLVVLADTLVAWSKIDDGTTFTPSTTTGAGAQLLSIISSGTTAYAVLGYAGGFLTYTRDGILRSELVLAANPFRHTVLSGLTRPLSPFAVVAIDANTHIYMSARGFYQVGREDPQLWQPLLSEHFHRTLLRQVPSESLAGVRMFYDDQRGWLVASLALSSDPELYNKAFIVYMPSQEVGVFNRPHTAFFPLATTDENDSPLFQVGMCDVSANLYAFNDSANDFAPYDKTLPITYAPAVREFIPHQDDGVFKFPSVLYLATYDQNETSLGAGWYAFNEYPTLLDTNDLAVEPEGNLTLGGSAPNYTLTANCHGAMHATCAMPKGLSRLQVLPCALDAWIEVGVFRNPVENDLQTNELVMLHEYAISMLDAGVADTFEDYIGDYTGDDVFFDWATDTSENEDWGFGSPSVSTYTFTARGTIDGYNTWQEQAITPDLVSSDGRTRNYSGRISGVYHLLRFDATQPNESFHLKQIELGLFPIGVLT